MPEHHSPDTDSIGSGSLDLDRAFDSLTRDLAARPGAPGATAAVATARRRRRTALASAGAVAVLAVGAAALPQLVGGSEPDSDRPTEVASSGDPVTFSGAAFTEATDGWTGPWREPARGDDLEGVEFGEPRCLDELAPAGNLEPRRVGDSVLLADADTGTYVTFAEFGSPGDTARVLDTFAPAAVQRACGVATDEIVVGRTQVRHVHANATEGEPAVDWWLAIDGARLAMVLVVAPEGGAPDEVQADVAVLLDRALDADDNFESSMLRGGSGSGSSSSGTVGGGDVPTYPALDRGAVMEVTDGWPAQVTTTGRLSCTEQFSLVGMKWQSMSSDDAGTSTTHTGFEDEPAARAAADQVADQLEACVPYEWRIAPGTLHGGRTLSAGSEQGTLVLVQRGAVVAWVTIGEPDAPEAATQAIASLLHDTLVVGGKPGRR